MGRVIVLATPVFFALIALEFVWGRRRGHHGYRLADSVNSLALGIMSQYTAVFTRLLRVGIYAAIGSSLALVPAGAAAAFWTSPPGWVLALLFYDVCYYWQHRLSHERTLLWAAHVVHHQSQHYNLSTALRQSSTGVLLGWVFYVPMALAGVPPAVFAVVGLIDLLYQFWVHTEQVGRLGWFDRWFVSPSNHRVHHAIEDEYLDRNYGGILIVWDRLFGTFTEERGRCTYGTRKPLDSWDPVWANAEVYAGMLRDSWHTGRWRDKLRVLVSRTGWRPADVAARFPAPVIDPAAPGERYAPRQHYDVAAGTPARVLALVCFGLALAGATAFLWHGEALPWPQRVTGAVALTALLWLAGALLQARLPAMLGAAGLAAVGATVGATLAAERAGGIDWLTMGRVCKPLVLGLVAGWAVIRWRAAGAGQAPACASSIEAQTRAAGWRTHGLLIAALLASLIGDVALMFERGFLPGLVAFLLAHLAYLVLLRRDVGWLPDRAWLAAAAAFGAVMLAVLWRALPAGLHLPVIVYVAAISTMGAQALGRARVRGDAASAAVAAGALLFMASDTLLALNRFVAPLPAAPLLVLSTYFTAQLLIARFALSARSPRRA